MFILALIVRNTFWAETKSIQPVWKMVNTNPTTLQCLWSRPTIAKPGISASLIPQELLFQVAVAHEFYLRYLKVFCWARNQAILLLTSRIGFFREKLASHYGKRWPQIHHRQTDSKMVAFARPKLCHFCQQFRLDFVAEFRFGPIPSDAKGQPHHSLF